MVPLASMLIGHRVDLVAVLDGDEPGRREGRKLVERLLGDENRTVFAGDYTADGDTTGETEDLFPDDYYLAAVKRGEDADRSRFRPVGSVRRFVRVSETGQSVALATPSV